MEIQEELGLGRELGCAAEESMFKIFCAELSSNKFTWYLKGKLILFSLFFLKSRT